MPLFKHLWVAKELPHLCAKFESNPREEICLTYPQIWDTWKVLWDPGHSKMWEIKTGVSCQVQERSIYHLVLTILFSYSHTYLAIVTPITFFE